MPEETRPDDRERCDYCRLPMPVDPVTEDHGGEIYRFCCRACRDAMEDSERVFTEYRGHRWITTGVSALDARLPQGIPRNSFVLLSGQAGTREEALQAELVWRTLRRGEPVIFATFSEPPVSVVERFLTLDWNVLPYLEEGRLHLLDCFTYRVQDRARMLERMDDWNSHVNDIAERTTTSVHDPTEVSQLESKFDDCLDGMEMVDEGLVVIDSLTEFGTLLQPIQAYNFVKDIRADVCKGRFVPVFAGATVRADSDEFPHDLEYMMDGVVDMRLNPDLVEDTLIKQVRVRKMSGVLSISEWTSYEFTSGTGIVAFDPREEIEKSRTEQGEGNADVAGDGDTGSGGEDRAEPAAGDPDGAGAPPDDGPAG